MPKCDKLLDQARGTPTNVRFTDLCALAGGVLRLSCSPGSAAATGNINDLGTQGQSNSNLIRTGRPKPTK